jgi:hypothetical protein
VSENGATARALRAVGKAAPRHFVSARELSAIIGRSEKSLERDRTLRKGFPYFKILGQVRYDLDECMRIVESGRIEPENA